MGSATIPSYIYEKCCPNKPRRSPELSHCWGGRLLGCPHFPLSISNMKKALSIEVRKVGVAGIYLGPEANEGPALSKGMAPLHVTLLVLI